MVAVNNCNSKQIKNKGFTIVELLVVIVVIGILAAITLVTYSGISQRAVVASLKSDLSNSLTKLELYQVQNGSYPTMNDCSSGPDPVPPKICLKSSPGNSYIYSPASGSSPRSFVLMTTNNDDVTYQITGDSNPTEVVASGTVHSTYSPNYIDFNDDLSWVIDSFNDDNVPYSIMFTSGALSSLKYKMIIAGYGSWNELNYFELSPDFSEVYSGDTFNIIKDTP